MKWKIAGMLAGGGGALAVLGLFVVLLRSMDNTTPISNMWPLFAGFIGIFVWVVLDRWLEKKGQNR